MKVDSISFAGPDLRKQSSPVDVLERRRNSSPLAVESSQDEKKAPQEEVLNKIKALTEDGLYSVRFELNKDADRLIIRIVDSQSGETIRQVPPEELIETFKQLREFRGMIVDTKS